MCPYGLAWVDNPNGDLDHSGARNVGASGQLVTVYTYNEGPSVPVDADGFIDVQKWENFNPAAQAQEGHFYSECSNKGLCDRSSGLCVCFDGYTGSSCQRTTCPNDCSGNGVCRTVEEIAAGNLPNSVAAGAASFGVISSGLNKRQVDNVAGKVTYDGIETATKYRLWDADMAQACVCDPGFSGPDCSRRECPRGDDPLTHRYGECPDNSDSTYTLKAPCRNEVQSFDITISAGKADWFHILFTDWTGKIWKTDDFLLGDNGIAACTADATLPLAASATTVRDAVKNALENIPNGIIPSVTVTATYSVTKFIVQVEFDSNPGNLPMLEFVNSLDMQVNLPVCITSDRDVDGTVAVTSLFPYNGNKELSTCSNRGVCDYTSGLCKCFKGYYGGDCSMQNALSQ